VKLAGLRGKSRKVDADALRDEHGNRFSFQKDEFVLLEEARAPGNASELLLDLRVLGEPVDVQRAAVARWLALQATRQFSVSRLLIDDLGARGLLPDGADAEPPRTQASGEVVINLAPGPLVIADDDDEESDS
jgi:hypothetical protein